MGDVSSTVTEGTSVGNAVGLDVSVDVTADNGCRVGEEEGRFVVSSDGPLVGMSVLGESVGSPLGLSVGVCVV